MGWEIDSWVWEIGSWGGRLSHGVEDWVNVNRAMYKTLN